MDVSQNDAGGNSDEGKDSPVFIFQYGRAACFLKFRNGMCTLYIVLLILRSMYWPGDIGDTGTTKNQIILTKQSGRPLKLKVVIRCRKK